MQELSPATTASGAPASRSRGRRAAFAAVLGALLLAALPAAAQILVVANDEKVTWDDEGRQRNLPPGKDAIDILDIRSSPATPKLLGTVALSTTVLAPPTTVAVLPGNEVALVASGLAWQKEGDGWKPVPDNKLHVVDLKASPPRLGTTIETGWQPQGIAVNRKGDLALVANFTSRSISVLAIDGHKVQLVDTVLVGDSVAAVAFTPDGRHALAVKPLANRVAWLDVDERKVTYDGHDMIVGSFPANVETAGGGSVALVTDTGAGGGADGNVDTVAVLDLEAKPPRVVDFVVVGDAPEGLAVHPKGGLAAVLLSRGANADRKAFYHHKTSAIAVLRISGKRVTKVAEVEVGALARGVAFSPDGKFLYVGNFLDGDVSVLKVDGTKLTDAGPRLKVSGHPAALRASPR